MLAIYVGIFQQMWSVTFFYLEFTEINWTRSLLGLYLCEFSSILWKSFRLWCIIINLDSVVYECICHAFRSIAFLAYTLFILETRERVNPPILVTRNFPWISFRRFIRSVEIFQFYTWRMSSHSILGKYSFFCRFTCRLIISNEFFIGKLCILFYLFLN